MGGMKEYLPWTAAVMWIATLAIAGIPGFSGFFSKDGILAAVFSRGHDATYFYVLWGVGAVAALLTAFYMTRMMIYTFSGPNRTGEAERKELHEAPWVMTGPLVALAAGSVLAGLLNLPHVLPGAGWLEHWLEPVTDRSELYLEAPHLSAGTEWMLMGIATVIAVLGIVGAFRLLRPEELKPAAEAQPETGLQKVLVRKWYVDEIYDALVVRPTVWLSRKVLWRIIDVGIIDRTGVNGSANMMRFFGWVGSRFQTGQLGTYLFLFVIGALVLLRVVTRGP